MFVHQLRSQLPPLRFSVGDSDFLHESPANGKNLQSIILNHSYYLQISIHTHIQVRAQMYMYNWNFLRFFKKNILRNIITFCSTWV